MKNITKIKEQNDGTSLYELAISPKLELPTFFSYRERKVSKKDATAEHPAGSKKRIAFNYSTNEYVDVADVAGEGFVELNGKRQSAEVITVRYVEELDCIMLAKGSYATTIKLPEAGRYQEMTRAYITRDKKVFTSDTFGRWHWICVNGSYKKTYNYEGNPKHVYDYKNNLSDFTTGSAIAASTNEQILAACKALWGFEVAPVEGNRSVTLNSIYNLVNFVRHKSRTKRNGPKQRAIDELTAIELPEINSKESYGRLRHANVGYICRADDKCVVRIFNNGYESTRFYVGKKGVNACNRADDGTWVARPFTAKSGSYDWTFSIKNVDKDVVAGTQLEYLVDMIEGIEESDRGRAVWALLVMPYLERVMKYDERLKDIITRSLKSYDPMRNVESYIGVLKDAKKINAVLGFNKAQLDFFAARKYRGLSVLKTVFGNTLLGIDNDTIEFLCTLIDSLNSVGCLSSIMQNIATIAKNYGWPTMRAVGNTLIELVKQSNGRSHYIWNRRDTSGCSNFALYVDYLSMVVEMGCNLPVNIPNASIRYSHDMAVELFNMHEIAVEKEKWDKRTRSWNKWTFAPEDEAYIVVAPQEPHDLAKEGITLSHCVKNYISRVSDGATNIMFIRKKDEPDTPFYTVEVGNGGTIEQIHGFANCNLDKEPALIPFVDKWIKACKLKSNNFNKVR